MQSVTPQEHSLILDGKVQEVLGAEPRVVQVAYMYLGTLGCTLWRDWIIATPEGRLTAARWLASQYMALHVRLTNIEDQETRKDDNE